MAQSLTTTVTSTMDWQFVETLDLGTVSDSSFLQYQKTLNTGTAADLADLIFHEQRTLSSTTNQDYDLTALNQNAIFANATHANTVTINFTDLKGIFIVRTDTDATATLSLDSSVANSILGPFNGDATAEVDIQPESMILLTNKVDGWPVTADTADILRVKCVSTSSATYKIVLWGTSA